MTNLQFGALVFLVVILVAVSARYVALSQGYSLGKDGFASKEAVKVAGQAREVFESRGVDVPYREYRKKVDGADPVQFHRVREIARSGDVTPEAVQQVL